jgi:predicted GIY-YIG superfamily endonuclease
MAGRWWVYVLRCGDGTLYTGATTDVARRLAVHQAGRGARYTRGRGPLIVIAVRRCRDKEIALRIEHAVKRLSRADKLALATAPQRLVAIARAAHRKRARASQRGSARQSMRTSRAS